MMHGLHFYTRRVLQSRQSMANLGWSALEPLAASISFASSFFWVSGIQMKVCMYEVMSGHASETKARLLRMTVADLGICEGTKSQIYP